MLTYCGNLFTLYISNHYVIYLKLMQYYVHYTYLNKEKIVIKISGIIKICLKYIN